MTNKRKVPRACYFAIWDLATGEIERAGKTRCYRDQHLKTGQALWVSRSKNISHLTHVFNAETKRPVLRPEPIDPQLQSFLQQREG